MLELMDQPQPECSSNEGKGWRFQGPKQSDISRQFLGRFHSVAVDPTDPNFETIYAGSPTSGLWIIMDRYAIIKNKNNEEALIEKAWSINGLMELVVEILKLEAGYLNNEIRFQKMFDEVIREEILKKGVPENDV